MQYWLRKADREACVVTACRVLSLPATVLRSCACSPAISTSSSVLTQSLAIIFFGISGFTSLSGLSLKTFIGWKSDGNKPVPVQLHPLFTGKARRKSPGVLLRVNARADAELIGGNSCLVRDIHEEITKRNFIQSVAGGDAIITRLISRPCQDDGEIAIGV